jgi:hypothetical protein
VVMLIAHAARPAATATGTSLSAAHVTRRMNADLRCPRRRR